MIKNKQTKNGAAVTTTKASKSTKSVARNTTNKCAAVASETQTQNYTLTSPKGKQYAVSDLNKFAAKHELDASALRRVARGQRLSHREWTAALVG